jgi:hypothetical protein|nr:MAG TPA: hypothetical protein [Caudoviricetes sp.]
MEDLRDYTAFFYFYIEDEEVYTRIKLEGMQSVDKMSTEEDEKTGEVMKKNIAKMLNKDIEKVRRVSKKEYLENVDEDEEEE